jgi:hypothetical protein
MIEARDIPINDSDTKDLARRLLTTRPASSSARLTWAIEMDGGVIATSEPEARAVLGVVDHLLDRGPSDRLFGITRKSHRTAPQLKVRGPFGCILGGYGRWQRGGTRA